MNCTEQRVTVLGFGELGDGAEFSFPLPPSLSAVNERRRLTITLAWLSPVTITIKINCRADAGDIPDPIPYGLAVTLEVIERVTPRLFGIPLYQEVRDRLAIRVPVQSAGTP